MILRSDLLRHAGLLSSDRSIEGTKEIFVSLVFLFSLSKRGLWVIIESYIVLMNEKVEFDCPCRCDSQKVLNSDEVLQAFGHFKLVDVQMADMDEVLYPFRLIVVCLGLGEFVFVMREDEIDTS